jgi:hypothetical protein
MVLPLILGVTTTVASAATVKLSVPPSPIGGTVSLTAQASPKNVRSIEIRIDGTTVKTCLASPCPFAWNSTQWPDGSHQLQARAVYAWSSTSSSVSTVTVKNVVAVPPPPPPPPPPGGPVFHVDVAGNDANDGSPDRPWRTIQRAANAVVPGATVLVAPGTYVQAIATSRHGTATARIRYVSTQQWGARIISAQPQVWRNTGHYVDIVGFDVSGTEAAYIGIGNSGSNVVIRDNHVHDIPAAGCTSNGGAGILSGNYTALDVDIIGNVVRDIGGFPASCNRVQGIYHSHRGGHIWNNIVYRIVGYGIHLWHFPYGVTIANNLVFQSLSGGILMGSDDIVADEFVVTNNIVFDNPGYGIREIGRTGVNNRFLNNLVYRNGSNWRLLTGTQSGTVAADPKFVNYQASGNGDYHLAPTSPAIDTGTSEGAPPDDFDGTPRPQGAGWTIGPYERP